MYAEKAVYAMLTAYAGLTALVGSRIYSGGVLPQGCALPAVTAQMIGSSSLQTIDANGGYNLMRARIQLTVFAKSYPAQKTLMEQVRKACNNQRGVWAGVTVISALRDTVGADLRDDSKQIYEQTLDFQVTYQEPA